MNMKAIANSNLKREIVLMACGFGVRKQDGRIQQFCIWDEHCIIDGGIFKRDSL